MRGPEYPPSPNLPLFSSLKKEAKLLEMEKLNKNQLTDLFNQGTSELNYGNPLKAIEYYKKILCIKKDNEIILNNLAYAYFIIGDYINSEKLILRTININKNNPNFYYNLGNLYKRISKLDDAVKNYDKAILLESNNHDYYYNKKHTHVCPRCSSPNCLPTTVHLIVYTNYDTTDRLKWYLTFVFGPA